MRKLASVRKIKNIKPIENADAIEVAVVDNWEVVVKKGEYQAGDVCVYCEIDSFLPIKPEFEFLRASSFRKMGDKEGFALRTIKLRGQISQGLILPIDALQKNEFNIGDDVSEYLGIIKYVKPIPACLAGDMAGAFPDSLFSKTDQERVQNLDYDALVLQNDKWTITEKLDGASVTYFVHDGEFRVCSRNWELKESRTNLLWQWAIRNNFDEALKSIGKNICLQGEIIGNGIQKNPYSLQNIHAVNFYCGHKFNETLKIYEKLSFEEFYKLCKELDFITVPIMDINYQLPQRIEDLIERANFKSIINIEKDSEGLVLYNCKTLQSFKVISNKYLLKK